MGERGEPITDCCFLVLFNAEEGDRRFSIPPELTGRNWYLELDSAEPKASGNPLVGSLAVAGWSVVVLSDGARS